jgi:hypothetical protein
LFAVRISSPCLRRALLHALTAVALGAVHAGAQGTATIPPSDEAYRDFDRLSELGYLDSTIVAQRPYSRREIGRLLRAARERSTQLGEGGQSLLITDLELTIGDGILRRLETRFSREIEDDPSTDALLALDDARVSLHYTDAPSRAFVGTYGSTLEATMGALLPRRLGAPFVPGTTLGIEVGQRLEATSWLAFSARERAEYPWAKDTALRKGSAEILLASVRARYRNVALELGRSQLSWAQSPDEGLFIAADAPGRR